MSSPVCAGGVALWLQADPTLTFDDVKSIIEETADKDEFVTNGIYPAAKWGAGKFNAMAGLRKVLGLPTGGVNAALTDDMRLIITSDNNAIEAFVAVKMAWWLLCTIWAVCSAQVPRLRATQ